MLAWASENLLYTGSEVPQSHFPAATSPKMLHGAAWDQSRGISACPGALLFSHSATCCQNINRQKKNHDWEPEPRNRDENLLVNSSGPWAIWSPLIIHLYPARCPPSLSPYPLQTSLSVAATAVSLCFHCFPMHFFIVGDILTHLTFKNKSCFLLWTLTLHILGNRRLMSWNFFLKNQILI